MQVIIVGGGKTGAHLASRLTDDGIAVTVIEQRAEVVERVRQICPNASVIEGSGSDPEVLERAGVRIADAVAAVTGLDETNLVIWASIYSLGVAALRRATAMVARTLAGWDVEIVETHHNQKVDAPSGTAKALLAAIDPEGERRVVNGRTGQVGARVPGEIGMHAIRGGTVAGTHEVHFFGTDEEVCLTHRATSRQIFVTGAVAAAARLLERPAGFYDFDALMFG